MRHTLSLGLFIIFVGALLFPISALPQISVGIAITVPPPELPVYEQPLCPGDGYIWTPGYWAWGDDDYFWVPGTWVLAPEVGFFWTPGYWGWGGSSFIFHEGYWGPVVGFYGGINYGFGYFGHGYEGGRWDHDHFYYNRSVNNVNVTEIHNVYNTTVVNERINRVSYNGGNGGINVHPTAQEESAARERHVAPVPSQVQHVQTARTNPQLRVSANHGQPPIAATPKPGAFSERAAGPPKDGGAARVENNVARTNSAIHPKELPPADPPATPSTGSVKKDQKYQQQQEKLQAKQQQQLQKLQQKQDQEHQRMEKQKADDAQRQRMEQQHQQQTQKLAQQHIQQQQKLQSHNQPPPAPKPSQPKH